MICQSCLRRIRLNNASTTRLFSSAVRQLAGTGQPSTPAPRGPPRGSHEGAPAATSTSAAQPFSSQMNDIAQPPMSPQKLAEVPKSSVLGGMALRGLGFYKNKEPPIAMEDHEYPEWLWGLLKTRKGGIEAAGGEEADLYAKTRRQRRAAAKAARKTALKNPGGDIPQIPLEEQTIDLPSGDGTIKGAIQAMEARDDLTLAMRQTRRKNIKETNFLKGMR